MPSLLSLRKSKNITPVSDFLSALRRHDCSHSPCGTGASVKETRICLEGKRGARTPLSFFPFSHLFCSPASADSEFQCQWRSPFLLSPSLSFSISCFPFFLSSLHISFFFSLALSLLLTVLSVCLCWSRFFFLSFHSLLSLSFLPPVSWRAVVLFLCPLSFPVLCSFALSLCCLSRSRITWTRREKKQNRDGAGEWIPLLQGLVGERERNIAASRILYMFWWQQRQKKNSATTRKRRWNWWWNGLREAQVDVIIITNWRRSRSKEQWQRTKETAENPTIKVRRRKWFEGCTSYCGRVNSNTHLFATNEIEQIQREQKERKWSHAKD